MTSFKQAVSITHRNLQITLAAQIAFLMDVLANIYKKC